MVAVGRRSAGGVVDEGVKRKKLLEGGCCWRREVGRRVVKIVVGAGRVGRRGGREEKVLGVGC